MDFSSQTNPAKANAEQRRLNVSILSESPADEAAIFVLATAILGAPVRHVQPDLRARGWPNVVQVLPAIIRHLHFNTPADGLVVVVDSDDSVVHTVAHDAPGYFHPHCRMCHVRAVFRRTVKRLPRRRVSGAPRASMLRCVGIAVPAVEAWYLCGRAPDVTEAAWVSGLERGRTPYTRRELKQRVYGTDRPSLNLEIDCALKEVARHRGDVRRLEADFPSGFGALAEDLRSWLTEQPLDPIETPNLSASSDEKL